MWGNKCRENFHQRSQPKISKRVVLNLPGSCCNTLESLGNSHQFSQFALVKWVVCRNLPGSFCESPICPCSWLHLPRGVWILFFCCQNLMPAPLENSNLEPNREGNSVKCGPWLLLWVTKEILEGGTGNATLTTGQFWLLDLLVSISASDTCSEVSSLLWWSNQMLSLVSWGNCTTLPQLVQKGGSLDVKSTVVKSSYGKL